MARHVLVEEAGAGAGPMLCQHLSRRGMLPHPADSPADALVWARQRQPDLVVLRSPELLRDLRFHPATGGLAIVQIGPPGPDDKLRVEPDALLPSPFTPAALTAAIDCALAARAQRRRDGVAADLAVLLPSDPAELEAFLDRLPGWLAGTGLAEFQRQQLALATREIVANAIEWGHRYDRERLVSIDCRLDAEKVTILIRDSGPGFDRHNLPHAARPGDPLSHLEVRAARQLRDGGFGILLARGLVDHLCYNEAGNEGLLVKYLPRPAYAAAQVYPEPLPAHLRR